MIFRILLVFSLMLSVSACVQPPKVGVSRSTIAAMRAAEVDVRITGKTKIKWPAVEDEYVATLGLEPPPEQYGNAVDEDVDPRVTQYEEAVSYALKTPEAREYINRRVVDLMKTAALSGAENPMQGQTPVTLVMDVKRVRIFAPGEILAGGLLYSTLYHRAWLDFSVVDQATGRTVIPPKNFRFSVATATGIGAAAVARQNDPGVVMNKTIALNIRKWLESGQ